MADDRQLLENYAQRGDVASLTALAVAHSRWLQALLRGLLPSEEDAEDAVQETWLRVIRSAASYRGGNVRAYLARIARSVAVDRFRKSGQPLVPLDAPTSNGETLGETIADGAPAPDAAFETLATSAEVRARVRSLPRPQRDVLLLRLEGELTFREIAEQLGIPLGTALTWMRTATETLRHQLAKKP